MVKLVVFNLILIALIVVGCILCKKFVKSEKAKRILLLVVALSTILCHYSSLLYHQIVDGTPMGFLTSNPNLILPIYPCNVVMWCCLILACVKFNTKFSKFLVDYIFLFGVISALVGMFVNIDFFNNPTLLNYDVTKGIVAHAIMLFNVALLPTLGFFKLDLPRNMLNIAISIVMMFVVGLYCNLVFSVVGSEQMAYNVNSMFILHSPFEGAEFLTYPTIAGIAIVCYFLIFLLAEFIAYKPGNRWYNRLGKKNKQ
ncbi:MAG: hypothetical protein MJ152_00040 [Clostridia bacterium]|nr:hypothetical protein [Clostridia bacterium]